MKQKLLFVLPDEDELLLAAIAAIESYMAKLIAEKARPIVTLVCKESWLTDIVVPPAYKIVSSLEEATDNYDMVVELTREKAQALANATGRSAASGFGVILGFESVNELPRLFQVKDPEYDLGILSWEGESFSKFCRSANRAFPEVKIQIIPTFEHSIDVHKKVFNSAMVVGYRSINTYLAACAKRALLELYPLTEEKSFFAKWSLGKYWQLVLETPESIEDNYQLLWRSFERQATSFFNRRLHNRELVHVHEG